MGCEFTGNGYTCRCGDGKLRCLRCRREVQAYADKFYGYCAPCVPEVQEYVRRRDEKRKRARESRKVALRMAWGLTLATALLAFASLEVWR